MNYKIFVNKATKEDGRNHFERCANVSDIPSSMRKFFSQCNPVDVEIMYPGIGAIKFYPVEQLDALQSEYGFSETNYIFASCQGDAIFEKDGKIYRSLHGHYRPELIASSFDVFLTNYINT